MGDFISDYFLLISVLAIVLIFLGYVILTGKRQPGRSDFMEQAQADSQRAREHMLAVEQKLDRMIELLEGDANRDA